MDHQNITKFQLHSMVCAVDFVMWTLDTGIDKDERPCFFCSLTGRREDGKGEVFKSSGLAICCPSDVWDKEAGIKVAFMDAAANLYRQNTLLMLLAGYTINRYQDTLWAAFQRSRHDQADIVEVNNWGEALAFA